MPIYAYKCQACGHQFDKIQRMSDAPLTDCPQCSKAELKKQVTAAAFKLTGTGWYETDFKNKQPAKDKTTAADSSTTKSTSDTKSDTKSESTKKDSKSTPKKDVA